MLTRRITVTRIIVIDVVYANIINMQTLISLRIHLLMYSGCHLNIHITSVYSCGMQEYIYIYIQEHVCMYEFMYVL